MNADAHGREGGQVTGAIIAGGASSRFGSPKALAEVGGVRIVDRVARALRDAVDEIIAIINDEQLALEVGLPHRPDVLQGAGALAGVHAALVWAQERCSHGVVAAGCDMPFVSSALLIELLAHAPEHDIVLPASPGPRGVEPLCAFYSTSCIAPIEASIARGDARMIGFHSHVRVHTLPPDAVREFGDPAILFMNLNTEQDRVQAELLVREMS
ncbi:MAG TPA: molybdenum cofactor guanylyltransferase [Longimicrobiales bacterium]|nr:molybdenum cofactor guanylyltransferase [Longimicrobiales bacterium]